MSNNNAPIVKNDDDYLFVGVISTYENLYNAVVFLAVLFLVGDVLCKRIFRIVPSLVGHIIVGIAFGPEGFDVFQSNSNEQWVLLGNLGLLLLILQAGLEMDMNILQLVGPRGVIIAIVGSILPISIGTAIASMFLLEDSSSSSWKSCIAAGCSFGPTSAGIAMNVLGQCGVLQLPVGQLIVAAAIIDDILALVVLSQLRSLTAEDPSLWKILRPIINAILWLFLGGTMALFVFPKAYKNVISCYLLRKREQNNNNKHNIRADKEAEEEQQGEEESQLSSLGAVKGKKNDRVGGGYFSLFFLFVVLFTLLPATYYTEASYLMGAFLSGLAFCQDEYGLEILFNSQFKRLIQWLMRIFFAATIGFQVPIRSFVDGIVLLRGLLFTLALLGKFAVGFMTPFFYGDASSQHRYKGRHLRDCFVVGFSMMGEAEFAFVVAGFGVTEGLVPPDIYSSIVLSILLSTVISPLLLRLTLAIYPYEQQQEQHSSRRSVHAKEGNIPPTLPKHQTVGDDNKESNNEIGWHIKIIGGNDGFVELQLRVFTVLLSEQNMLILNVLLKSMSSCGTDVDIEPGVESNIELKQAASHPYRSMELLVKNILEKGGPPANGMAAKREIDIENAIWHAISLDHSVDASSVRIVEVARIEIPTTLLSINKNMETSDFCN